MGLIAVAVLAAFAAAPAVVGPEEIVAAPRVPAVSEALFASARSSSVPSEV